MRLCCVFLALPFTILYPIVLLDTPLSGRGPPSRPVKHEALCFSQPHSTPLTTVVIDAAVVSTPLLFFRSRSRVISPPRLSGASTRLPSTTTQPHPQKHGTQRASLAPTSRLMSEPVSVEDHMFRMCMFVALCGEYFPVTRVYSCPLSFFLSSRRRSCLQRR
jgi:hypothetical protein